MKTIVYGLPVGGTMIVLRLAIQVIKVRICLAYSVLTSSSGFIDSVLISTTFSTKIKDFRIKILGVKKFSYFIKFRTALKRTISRSYCISDGVRVPDFSGISASHACLIIQKCCQILSSVSKA